MGTTRDAPVEHGVEGSNLVHPHSWHLQELRDIVHDANARPSLVLPLAEVEKGNDGSLLVLGRIPSDDFLRALHVLSIELERNLTLVVQFRSPICLHHFANLGVVVRSIPVLEETGQIGSSRRVNWNVPRRAHQTSAQGLSR